MKNQTIVPSNFSAVHNKEAVITFLQEKGIETTKNKDIVKSFFDGNDYYLAINDVRKQEHTMLLCVKNFARNEDLLIELNTIFHEKTKEISSYHILKFARQATDDIIGMIPTFQAFFGDQAIPVSTNYVQKVFAPQNTNIAA